AADVCAMDLLDTELVALAASGPHGLRTPFVLAGAKTLLVRRWGEPDRASHELLEEFYRRLLDGAGRADALRQAQLLVRSRYPYPPPWANFLCVGAGSPLPAALLPSAAGQRAFVEAEDPYVAGLPVAGKLFVGRTDVLQMIRNNLAPAAGKNILVLRG